MDLSRLIQRGTLEWEIPQQGLMRVPGLIYASQALLQAMDDKVLEQTSQVACLPGIVRAAYAMPDAQGGYGFPVGGVAAFDADAGGVVSAGGVGFDISSGVRCLLTGLRRDDVMAAQKPLAAALFEHIPMGVGSIGAIRLSATQTDAMLTGGAQWAVAHGWGAPADLDRTEEHGQMLQATPAQVSEHAKRRQRDEMGTLGSGNHYLEVLEVAEVFDHDAAAVYGLRQGDAVVMIHCGSRGLGHQIGTEFLRRMVEAAPGYGLTLTDRELGCAPIKSELGQAYLGSMNAAINCALANRQILTHLVRKVFARLLPRAALPLLYDASYNNCKLEEHTVDGRLRPLYVHRKGAARAFGPGHAALPESLRAAGQPVLVSGAMGKASYVMAGTAASESLAFSSACHSVGRTPSQRSARQPWQVSRAITERVDHDLLIRGSLPLCRTDPAPVLQGDADAAVDASDAAGLARKVARLQPMICIKG